MNDLILVIGNCNYSSWSLRPWFLLQKLQIPFQEVRLSLDTPEFYQSIGQWSPAGRVPVLRHGQLTVWDSLAICEYVNDALAPGQVWPSNLEERAQARALACEMHAGFTALRQEMPVNLRAKRQVTPSSACLADIHRIQTLIQDCRHRFAERGPWLFGQFCATDAMYAPVLTRFQTYGVNSPEAVQAYSQVVLTSPPLQRWLAAALGETEVIEADEVGDPA
jgi:glutathione S-transferase